ncbi:DUF3888 domain-containing protein [Evansella cellulosilytica]|uniref:DUF3888 domain-containing protein n=1 Tax=Evansella cellulosilytica (strain ATCC 21833 / DSM 2522 / FERM P-1141 / JCM 9156 / N-4) TaxID=649639 RepID=E6TVR7_EVAC2|nr:DUF3888 domain-containing protein [Evansella cellulosilytica]ADU32195.1 hypothetical protein Bcell_3962 [Evansella cellulosilytica DSM 2522]
MKIKIALLFILFIVLTPHVSAEELTSKEIYAAPEEVLVDMLHPYITEAVKKECGDNVTWSFERVKNIHLMVEHMKNKSRRWYEVSLTIRTMNEDNEADAWQIDTVTFNIDPKTYFGSSDVKRKSLKEVSVQFIDYIHHHDKN